MAGAIGRCVSGVEINSLLFVEKMSEFCIEACGITKSPLDDWRGSGRIAKEKGFFVSPVGGNVVMRPEYAFDIAGNNVKIDWEYVDKVEKERQEELTKYIATIKDIIPKQSVYKIKEIGEVVEWKDTDFETLLSQTLPPVNEVIVKPKRSISPCPCGSKECLEYFEKNK